MLAGDELGCLRGARRTRRASQPRATVTAQHPLPLQAVGAFEQPNVTTNEGTSRERESLCSAKEMAYRDEAAVLPSRRIMSFAVGQLAAACCNRRKRRRKSSAEKCTRR